MSEISPILLAGGGLLGFLRWMGDLLGATVTLYAEGGVNRDELALITYDPALDQVVKAVGLADR